VIAEGVVEVTDGRGGPQRYFAYGSNMSVAQMAERCPGAGSPLRAVLADHVWLCNERGVATIAPVPGRVVHGVLWAVSAENITALDRYEGVAGGRYRRTAISVTTADGQTVDALVYIDDGDAPGPPRDDYLERVLTGATEHGLPDDYIGYLRRWADVPRNPRPRGLDGEGPQTLTELLATPGVTEIVELRSSFGLMAIHAGELEQATDVVASLAAERSDSSYYGVIHPDDVDHHLPSIRYRPDESAALARFLDHVDIVISVHGYGRRGMWTSILAGGTNRELADHVAEHIRSTVDGYDVITDLDRIPRELRGRHRTNPVNLPEHGGVQLELPPRVRGLSPLSPPPGSDGLSAPTRALIAALAAAASSWTSQTAGR
jgi:phage replication-related protein YjqB (UPF0714/DUF867 family)/cation transport regulator ChaC